MKLGVRNGTTLKPYSYFYGGFERSRSTVSSLGSAVLMIEDRKATLDAAIYNLLESSLGCINALPPDSATVPESLILVRKRISFV